MIKDRVRFRFSLILILLLAAGCSVPTAPAPTSTVQPTIQPATSTSVPIEPTGTPIPATASPAQPTSPPTSQPTSAPAATAQASATLVSTSAAPVIQPGNITSLTSASVQLPDFVQQLAWPSSSQVIARTENGLLPIQLDPPKVGQPITLNLPDRIQDIAPDGSSLAVFEGSSAVGIFDLQGNKLRDIQVNQPYFASYSSDSQWIAVGLQSEHTVNIYNVSDGQQVASLSGFQTAAPIYYAMISPDKQTLVWIARADVQFQDISTGRMVKELRFENFVINHAFSADGSELALNLGDAIQVFSVPEGALITKLNISQPAQSLSFSPDGQLLAAGYSTSIQFWETAQWTPLQPVVGSDANIALIGFSPDGTRLVSMDENKLFSEWTVK